MRHGSKTFVYLALIAFGLIAGLLLAADVPFFQRWSIEPQAKAAAQQ